MKKKDIKKILLQNNINKNSNYNYFDNKIETQELIKNLKLDLSNSCLTNEKIDNEEFLKEYNIYKNNI